MIDRSCDVCGRTWLGVAERTLLLELEPAMRPGIFYGTDDDACPPGAAGLLEAMLAAWRDEVAPVPWPGDLVLQPHDLVVRRGSGALTVDHVGGGGDRRRADLAATPATPVVTSSVRANGLGCPWSRSTTYEGRSILMRHDGSTLKVNLCLSDLPRFTCLPEDCGQFGPTIHLLPDEGSCSPSLGAPTPMPRRVAPRSSAASNGTSTLLATRRSETTESSQRRALRAVGAATRSPRASGRRRRPGMWRKSCRSSTGHVLSRGRHLCPPPTAIEQHFGISRGHMHHVDNTIGFTDRHPYKYPIAAVYSCSAGCHPAGSVIGTTGIVMVR